MTDWKTINAHEQIDGVGNIYQYHGGVKPVACQKCKKTFETKIKTDPLIEEVPIYECENCNFKNPGGDATLQHKIETDHKIKRELKDRQVSVKRQLIDAPNIIHKENDVIILCNRCVEYGK